MALPHELAAKLGKPIRLLMSDSQGEALAALCAIARLLEEKHRLPSKHHEFIDDMASRTVYGREPTPKQHQYLHSLFFKLGGKIT